MLMVTYLLLEEVAYIPVMDASKDKQFRFNYDDVHSIKDISRQACLQVVSDGNVMWKVL